jgi:CheY-like chemotaxis protein
MNKLPIQSDKRVTRILVVDDLADNYFLLQMILKLEGYQVEVADSGHAALERVEATPPDLILLDVMMPGINGLEVTQRIRQNTRLPFIPILLITGYKQLEEAKALDMGANGLVYKPIDPDHLLEQVRDILGESLSPVNQPSLGN